MRRRVRPPAIWPARCASTRRFRICSPKITTWNRRPPRIAGGRYQGRHSVAGSSPDRRRAPAHVLAKGAARLVISLLPSTMHDVSPEKIHLVTGFRQHLIASLVRFREWQVTDAPSVTRRWVNARSAASRYELQMNVHQNGPALHLLLMLKEAENNLYVWSDGFELKLESWFELQRQVVQRIALALNVHLSAERLRRLSEYPDISLGIYDRWLRSQTLIRTFNLEHWHALRASSWKSSRRRRTSFPPIAAWPTCTTPSTSSILARLRTPRARTAGHPPCPPGRGARPVEHERAPLAGMGERHGRPAHPGGHAYRDRIRAQSQRSVDAFFRRPAVCLLRPDRSPPSWCSCARDMALVPSKMHWAYLVDIHFLSGDYEAADWKPPIMRRTFTEPCGRGGRPHSRSSAIPVRRPKRRHVPRLWFARTGLAPSRRPTRPSCDGCCISTRSASAKTGSGFATALAGGNAGRRSSSIAAGE